MSDYILQVPDELRPSIEGAQGDWHWKHLTTRDEAVTVYKEIGGRIHEEEEDWPVEYVCLLSPSLEPWVVMHFDKNGLDDIFIKGATSRQLLGGRSLWTYPDQYGEFRGIIVHAEQFLYPRFLAGNMTSAPANGETIDRFGDVLCTWNGVERIRPLAENRPEDMITQKPEVFSSGRLSAAFLVISVLVCSLYPPYSWLAFAIPLFFMHNALYERYIFNRVKRTEIHCWVMISLLVTVIVLSTGALILDSI